MKKIAGFAVIAAILIIAVSVFWHLGDDQRAEPVTGSAKLSWIPPTEREDGSTLDSIGGYTIYFGQDPERLEYTIEVSGEITEYEINDLDEGTWYFALSAKSDTGLESALSPLVSKII
jgi:hypothetical protein